MTKKALHLILKNFLESLSSSYHQTVNPINIIFYSPPPLFNELLENGHKDKSVFIEIKENIHPDESLRNLREALPMKKFIFLNIQGNIPKKLHRQLDLLSREGFMDASIARESMWVSEKVTSDILIFLVGKRNLLENQHGNLSNLSSNILDLT